MIKTPNVHIEVKTRYLDNQSDPANRQYVFSYTITIANQGDAAVQLMTREWTINDADGKITQVTGDGVVGQQPVIEPGQAFTYTSGTVLTTPLGSMQGRYGFIDNDGTINKVEIAPFRLAVPHLLH